jgi:hypothetical protein
MKKYIILFSSIIFLSVCASVNAHAADSQIGSSAAAAATVTQATYNSIISDPLYSTLLSKNNTKNNLIQKENQICKDIKNQENSNKEKAAAIIAKSQAYSTAYDKIIDDIKLLLDPIKEKDILYYKALTKSNSPGISVQEASAYDNQISSLNLAVKAMREAMKYISLESIAYQQKSEAVQKNIDQINISIDALDMEIVQNKINKDKEWNNFSSALIKGDLKAANGYFDNMLKIKEQIIQNYSLILKYKKDINAQLMSL